MQYNYNPSVTINIILYTLGKISILATESVMQ